MTAEKRYSVYTHSRPNRLERPIVVDLDLECDLYLSEDEAQELAEELLKAAGFGFGVSDDPKHDHRVLVAWKERA